MRIRHLTVLTLATLVMALTAATHVAGGNGGVPPAEDTGKKPAETEAPPDTVAEQYDIKALVARLRDTSAIGFFTKLALKNQIDDLMDRFRRLHAREEETPLDRLRDQFNLLFMKVITLLQDGDPALGQEIARGREILWGKLADPREFVRL
ncbi:MAG: hypothetical protein XU15_C0012G0104 [candidate division NC10 bacterium CSP1-5]|nr:MAG: hypothetical protein XU15_C0012G0104 [candidate division NC10 bacterium CSP1-5]